jgi:hypothetical protein
VVAIRHLQGQTGPRRLGLRRSQRRTMIATYAVSQTMTTPQCVSPRLAPHEYLTAPERRFCAHEPTLVAAHSALQITQFGALWLERERSVEPCPVNDEGCRCRRVCDNFLYGLKGRPATRAARPRRACDPSGRSRRGRTAVCQERPGGQNPPIITSEVVVIVIAVVMTVRNVRNVMCDCLDGRNLCPGA